MILTDTSVVIVCERALTPRLQRIITAHDAAVCGVTVAEMFVGARTAADEARIGTTLALFQRVPIPEALWEAAGRQQALLRAAGLTVQLSDTVIATLAVTLGVELWTYDIHFTRMAGVMPGLALFSEPP
jgi:predicted nucleic acid-binding protein